MIPEEKVGKTVSDITEGTGGRAVIELGDEEYFAVFDGQILRGDMGIA